MALIRKVIPQVYTLDLLYGTRLTTNRLQAPGVEIPIFPDAVAVFDQEFTGQHGLDHPTVFEGTLTRVRVQVLAWFIRKGNWRRCQIIDTSGCTEEDEVYWIVNLSGLSGLVPGFV